MITRALATLVTLWVILETNGRTEEHLVHGPRDYTVFTGVTVVLECEYNASSQYSPSWTWLHDLDENRKWTVQDDIYNECSGDLPSTALRKLRNAHVNLSSSYRRDLVINNITIGDAGEYICMDSCGLDGGMRAKVTVIKGEPRCALVAQAKPSSTVSLDRLSDRSMYSSQFSCSVEYMGTDDLVGTWVVAHGVEYVIHDDTSWTSTRTYVVKSEIFLNSSLYSSAWHLPYRIRSRNSEWMSDSVLAGDVAPPSDISIVSLKNSADSSQTFICEAMGNNTSYLWFYSGQNTIVYGDTVVIPSYVSMTSMNLTCLVVNSFGFSKVHLRIRGPSEESLAISVDIAKEIFDVIRPTIRILIGCFILVLLLVVVFVLLYLYRRSCLCSYSHPTADDTTTLEDKRNEIHKSLIEESRHNRRRLQG